MNSKRISRQRIPFADSKNAGSFGSAMIQKLVKEHTRLVTQHIPAENFQFFPHGKNWTFQQKREEGFVQETGEFEPQSTEARIDDDRILANELTLIDELIRTLSVKMSDGMQQRMIQEINDVCEKTGRVTAMSKGGSIVDALLESLEDIECGVDAEGNVSQPSMMLNPETIEKLKMELLVGGEEIQRRFKEMRQRVEKATLENEQKRIAKFRR